MEGGAQVKQNVNVECIQDFKDRPIIDLQFRYLSLVLRQVICSIVHSYALEVQEIVLHTYSLLVSSWRSVSWGVVRKR